MRDAPVRETERLNAVLAELEEMGWVKKTSVPKRAGPGRPRGDYTVNPRVFDGLE